MKKSSQPAIASDANPYIKVKHSDIHGNGVFAARKIPEGTRIIEYTGKRISSKEADKRAGLDPDNPHHTFFFAVFFFFFLASESIVCRHSFAPHRHS